MNGKQRTLFQAWGSGVAPEPRKAVEPLAKKAKAKKGKNVTNQRGPYSAASPAWQPAPQRDEAEDDDDDDDDVLLVAVYEAEKTFNATITHHAERDTRPDPTAIPTPCATDIQNLPGFDLSAGNVWIYPTNYAIREYQFTMAHTALLHNTLVCLPTGLGKTFIAAVVMYNFYRWYPSGKIVFMAPTKPLVAQQIEACFRVMGIPQEHMVEMTGNTQAHNRKDMWHNHRVFFLTPQIMVNDLTRGACPASEVKCLVIDEAHKALGNHAYCQVVRELCNYTRQFRILALSATPGSDTKSVQQVVTNLLIGRIELRSEDSPDIQPYSHERQLEKFVVPLGDELEVVQKSYLQVLETFAGRLIQNNVLSRREIPSLTKYQIILFRDQFRKNPPSNIVGAQMGVVEGDFALCISLYHGYELLLQMGTRSLFYYLQSIMDGSKGMTRARNDLGRNADFMSLYQQLESMFSPSTGSDVEKPFIYSHPKLKKLEEVVIQHFSSWNKQGQNSSEKTPEDTRIMIFSSFRDSVQEIAEMLNRHQPTVRVMTFVGHSSTGKGVKGYTQKEQLEVVKQFREGGYNTLVSTCVGEEGLDIGEVDLIICFDAQKSPIRLVQRMGRTGRKRQGRIVVILCKGREERTYNQSQSNKRSIYKAILGKDSIFHLNHESPRMVPEGLNPTVHKMYITQGTYDAKDAAKPISKDRRSSLVHRRSSVLFNKEYTNKKDWLLTQAEFETWNRLYRLTESNGLTDVVLPRTQFELFRDPETRTEQATGSVHELSLSEWKLWQNRPFPTHFVDHSVRSKNFIAVMQLIEQMREEEGDCSYDKEMNSFLEKADVLSSHKSKQNSRDCSTITSKRTKKLPAPKSKTFKNSDSSSVIENDEDFIPLLKLSRKVMSCSTEEENADFPDCPTEMEVSSDVEFRQDVEKDYDLADEMEIATYGDIDPNPSERTKTSPTKDENQALKSPTKADSGYHSFGEDTSEFLPSLFYTPYMQNNNHPVSEFNGKNSHVLSHMLSRVKKFLTCSPPSLSELNSLDDVDIPKNYLSDNSLPCEKGNPPILMEPNCSVKGSHNCIENSHSLVDVACLEVKSNDSPQKEPYKIGVSTLSAHDANHVETPIKNGLNNKEAQNDSHWDDIFDSDGNETYNENFCSPTTHGSAPQQDEVESDADPEKYDIPESSSPSTNRKEKIGKVVVDHNDEICSYSSILNKEKTESDETDIEATRTHSPHQSNDNLIRQQETVTELDSFPEYLEESFDLFEDEKFAEVEHPSSSTAYATTNPNHEKTAVNFNMFDPSLLMEDQEEEEPENKDCLSAYEEQAETENGFGSGELFSVNFDLGFSIDDDDDDDDDDHYSKEKNPEEVQPQNVNVEEKEHFKVPSPPNKRIIGGVMSTPVAFGVRNSSFDIMPQKQISPVGDKHSQKPETSLSSSFLTPVLDKVKSFKTPYNPVAESDIYSHSTPDSKLRTHSPLVEVKRLNPNPPSAKNVHSTTISSSPESEDDVVFRRKRKLAAAVLKSPETASSEFDLDSPMPGAKKCRRVLNAVCLDDDDDFAEDLEPLSNAHKSNVHDKGRQKNAQGPRHKRKRHAARQFLDEEAELSSEEAEFVSSDENVDSDNEQDTSLVEFFNDNTQLSQALNDSEMHGIYMKSIRSPAVGNKYKLTHKRHSLSVFSQIPEQDEDYMEDSFCVQEDEEEVEGEEEDSSTEEVQLDLDLLQQDSFVGGRRQYCTRRRLKLKGIQSKQGNQAQPAKKKRRIIVQEDSSDEETEVTSDHQTSKTSGSSVKSISAFSSAKPLLDSSSVKTVGALREKKELFDIPLKDRCQMRINAHASLSEELDFQTDAQSSFNISRCRSLLEHTSVKSGGDSTWMATSMNDSSIGGIPGSAVSSDRLCILADTREISSGPEVISCLKSTHGVQVEICSLGGCNYIVSNRLCVERKSQSEFSNCTNRSKLAERIQHLWNMFDRVCLIVEKDRVKPGEISRQFQRTKYYDSTLSSLISAGVQILFSSNQEDTAGLLKELASLERRKNTAITVPTQVTSHKQEVLNFYLSIPNVSYITALNLCHHFSSVRQMASSSVDMLSSKGQVSRHKAEEIYRYLHYQYDPQMLQAGDKRKHHS
ncbi:Fanconi anemia group M protein isoform X2 [Pyxicephalus adspersus]|uniref:Fanconi anemia group M protein isoform X2 n=1 Tax=Pyxicephalus adspersus TaxID=30357 RepID=UPI003B5C381B